MPVDRNLWKHAIAPHAAPGWPCPTCARGQLKLVRDSLVYEETLESRRSRSDEDHTLMDVSYEFSSWLACDGCHEKIACCGVGGYEPVESNDEDGNATIDYDRYFSPRYFSKSMVIFRPPLRCPGAIKDEIYRSFTVLFCDLSAAANHVRQCVENIMSSVGIEPQDDKGRFISLGRRIDAFRSRSAENAERSDALRWIGNFGSHPEALRKDDLFDAYDILEVLLEDLFIGHQRSVRQIVEQINSNRGPRDQRVS